MSKIDVILDISNKNLSSIPSYVLEMTNLKMLYLENNQIEVLPDELFTKLKKLVWLDLRKNKLKTIPQTIKNHECLETLLLRDNEIAMLPLELGLVPNLKVLQISGNPLVYPKKEIIQEGLKSIISYLKKQYDQVLEKGSKIDGAGPENGVQNNLKMVVSPKMEDLGLGDGEKMEKSGQKMSKNVRKESKCTLTIKTKAKRTPSKNATVYKDYQFRGPKNQNLKFSQEEKIFKDIWMQKFKDIMKNQDAELQREKDSETLRSWRQKTFKNSLKIGVDPAPFDLNEEYMRLPSRKDLKKDLNKDDRPRRLCKVQPRLKITDVDKFITDIVESLQNLSHEKTNEISPRSQMEKAGRDIKKIVDLQKRLSVLKLAIAKDVND